MNIVGFNLHITGQMLAMVVVHKCPVLQRATHHASFSPLHLAQDSPNSSWLTMSICWWKQKHLHLGKQLFKQVHLSGKDLPALDFPLPGTMLWISHSKSLVGGLAIVETCQFLTFSSNKSFISDPFKVKTTHRKPGKNLKYSLSLHCFYNF